MRNALAGIERLKENVDTILKTDGYDELIITE